VIYPCTFGYALFRFDPDKIILGVGLHLFMLGKCEKGSLLMLLHVHRYTFDSLQRTPIPLDKLIEPRAVYLPNYVDGPQQRTAQFPDCMAAQEPIEAAFSLLYLET
jgi:hypothetical protein